MGRAATKAVDSIYYQARMRAAKWNDTLSSRAGAAAVFHVSPDVMNDIERMTYILTNLSELRYGHLFHPFWCLSAQRKGMVIKMKAIKKLILCVLLLLTVAALAGCTKKQVYTIEANQTAFLIPLKGDVKNQASFESEELLSEAKVAAKQVYITYTRERLGPMHHEYVADNLLIIVDRTPVTREWSETVESGTSTNNQAIYAESKESIGFNVGMNCSAQIYSEEDAVKFLYCYNNKTLSDIIDSEIRARVESDFVETCAKYTMNEILAKKAEIMDYVRDDVTSYFAERGITITVLGMKDGIEYDDPSVQTAINASFVAERNAEAQRVNNETAIAKAQAEGEAEIISADATAKANRLLAESITDKLVELKKIERWNGQLPKATGAEASIIDIGE